jgi:hypothetical protein
MLVSAENAGGRRTAQFKLNPLYTGPFIQEPQRPDEESSRLTILRASSALSLENANLRKLRVNTINVNPLALILVEEDAVRQKIQRLGTGLGCLKGWGGSLQIQRDPFANPADVEFKVASAVFDSGVLKVTRVENGAWNVKHNLGDEVVGENHSLKYWRIANQDRVVSDSELSTDTTIPDTTEEGAELIAVGLFYNSTRLGTWFHNRWTELLVLGAVDTAELAESLILWKAPLLHSCARKAVLEWLQESWHVVFPIWLGKQEEHPELEEVIQTLATSLQLRLTRGQLEWLNTMDLDVFCANFIDFWSQLPCCAGLLLQSRKLPAKERAQLENALRTTEFKDWTGTLEEHAQAVAGHLDKDDLWLQALVPNLDDDVPSATFRRLSQFRIFRSYVFRRWWSAQP